MAETTNIKTTPSNELTPKAKAFGTYLRELRKSRKLNQSDIAQQVLVTTGYYGFFEQGRQIPSLKIINRLADVLNTDYLEMALRAGYDEFEARKKQDYRPKKNLQSDVIDQEAHQGGGERIDDGSGSVERTGAGTIASEGDSAQGSLGASQTSNPTSLVASDSGADNAGLDQPRIDWAMECISRDPTYRLSEQFRGELPNNIKALVIQLYQAQTQRQLLTNEESLALGQMVHG